MRKWDIVRIAIVNTGLQKHMERWIKNQRPACTTCTIFFFFCETCTIFLINKGRRVACGSHYQISVRRHKKRYPFVVPPVSIGKPKLRRLHSSCLPAEGRGNYSARFACLLVRPPPSPARRAADHGPGRGAAKPRAHRLRGGNHGLHPRPPPLLRPLRPRRRQHRVRRARPPPLLLRRRPAPRRKLRSLSSLPTEPLGAP